MRILKAVTVCLLERIPLTRNFRIRRDVEFHCRRRNGSIAQLSVTLAILLCNPIAWWGCGVIPSGHDDESIVPDPLRIEITGAEYEWHIRYAGLDGDLGTEDDRYAVRHMHIPSQARIVLTLRSEDYLYSLALPDQDVKEIAVPDLTFEATVETGVVGVYELKGDQFCGFSHPKLSGEFVVESRSEFVEWLEALPPFDRRPLSSAGK